MASLLVKYALLTLPFLVASTTVTYSEQTDLSKQLGCTPLRMLPVGDSITKGYTSTSDDGYRGFLQALLVNSTSGAAYGADVDFVGTLHDGAMMDNSHDGYSGAVIDEITPLVQLAIPVKPNVVLIHVGTNDMSRNVNVCTAPDRLETLVRAAHDGAPNAVLFVAQIIFAKSNDTQTNIEAYNAQIPGLISKLRAPPNNFTIVDVDMSNILNPYDMDDDKHPNDQGYKIMAETWYSAIVNATSAGMIKPADAPPSNPLGLGLGLDGTLLTPNITCRLQSSPTSTTAGGPSGTAAATPSHSGGAASGRFIVPSSLLALMLPLAIDIVL